MSVSRRRVGLVGLLCICAIAVVTVVVTRAGRDQPPIGTSLIPADVHGNDWLLPGGGVVTEGIEVLRVGPGRPPVTITDVRLVGARDVRLIGARVSGPQRETYQFTGTAGFPSTEGRGSDPAIGATITDAKRGWGLLVGLQVGTTDYPLIQGVEVRYSVGDKAYRQVFRGSIIFCTGTASPDDGHCHPPASLEKLVGRE